MIFGRESGFGASFSVNDLDGTNGFRLQGAIGDDHAGYSVSGVGDVNGDGFDDVIVGAEGADAEVTTSSRQLRRYRRGRWIFGGNGSRNATRRERIQDRGDRHWRRKPLASRGAGDITATDCPTLSLECRRGSRWKLVPPARIT